VRENILPVLEKSEKPDLVIANAEGATGSWGSVVSTRVIFASWALTS
jgi:calcineurin-like phosphoesterase